jgi:urease accessory protein
VIAIEPRAAPVQGRLELVFAPGRAGTSLAHAHVSAPLKIVRPFPLDGGRALVQILTLGPGFCAGDHYTLDVTVEPGARAVVIMQTASRVLGMTGGAHATQMVNLTVHSDGQLEYYPGLTIPFADSSLVQRVHVAAAAGARVGILENWSMGRSSRGEHLQFRRLSSRTTVAMDGALAGSRCEFRRGHVNGLRTHRARPGIFARARDGRLRDGPPASIRRGPYQRRLEPGGHTAPQVYLVGS